MAVYPTSVIIEMYSIVPLVDESGNTLVDESGNTLVADGWKDISADVFATSCVWTRGNNGRTIFDRVADIGTFSFILNNSEFNSEGTATLYSPDSASVVAYFGLDAKIRMTITENSVTHQEWQGKITSISPAFGTYGEQTTRITCEDWMANAYRDKIRGITVQTDKRDDQLLDTLLLLSSIQPLATDFSTGDDVYTYALHDENSLTSTLGRVFQKIAMSGLGRIYLTGYETLTYRSRSNLILVGTPDAVFSDNMQSLKVTRRKNQRVREIFVTTYPSEINAAAVVLWQAQKELVLNAGETKQFDISLRDPSGRATRVAALSLTAPVANTDYKFSSTTGTGTDLNASLGITVTSKADIATVSVTNNAIVTGYLWFHQQRGIGVYLYEPVTSYGETGQLDGETINVDMIYQDDENIGEDIKDLLIYWHAFDQSDVESMSFVANYSQDFMTAAFLSPGALITVTETQTGINENFIVNGIKKRFLSPYVIEVTWSMIKANQLSDVWFLEVAGASELDSTTRLGA